MSTKSLTTTTISAQDAGQGIQVSLPRKIRTWGLFTKGGLRVFPVNYGKTSTLECKTEYGSQREQSKCFEYDGAKNRAWRIAKAEKSLGVECEWREIEATEMMAVHF